MSGVCKNVLADEEIDVLRLMAEGATVELIARRLDMSERTVRRKARGACVKLDCDTTIEAIVWGVRNQVL